MNGKSNWHDNEDKNFDKMYHSVFLKSFFCIMSYRLSPFNVFFDFLVLLYGLWCLVNGVFYD